MNNTNTIILIATQVLNIFCFACLAYRFDKVEEILKDKNNG